ncbi:MAG TPA: hypothetical protein VKR32_19010 [Puia sp.]|nr:hypothetical protein [Puia sp.]
MKSKALSYSSFAVLLFVIGCTLVLFTSSISSLGSFVFFSLLGIWGASFCLGIFAIVKGFLHIRRNAALQFLNQLAILIGFLILGIYLFLVFAFISIIS